MATEVGRLRRQRFYGQRSALRGRLKAAAAHNCAAPHSTMALSIRSLEKLIVDRAEQRTRGGRQPLRLF